MLASLLLALAWAAITPAFQAPDEQSHFAYVQYLGETGKLPGSPARPIYSTEHALAAFVDNADALARNTYARPEWSRAAYKAWQRTHASDRRDNGGGPTSASGYPP